MKDRDTIIKVSIVISLLVIESLFCKGCYGLYFLTAALGAALIRNTIYFIRYMLFVVTSSLLLIPMAWLLHSHHYEWNSIATRPVLYPLANAAEKIIINSAPEEINKRLDTLFHEDFRNNKRFVIEYSGSGKNIFYQSLKELPDGYITQQTVLSDSKRTQITYMRTNPYFWKWDKDALVTFRGSYFSYWKALFKGEVIWNRSGPPKYTDFFFVHIILILLIINIYLHINFIRNYRRSQLLIDRLKTYTSEKLTER